MFVYKNDDHVHPFITGVNNEVGQMLAIREGYTRTFRRDEHGTTYSSLDRSSTLPYFILLYSSNLDPQV